MIFTDLCSLRKFHIVNIILPNAPQHSKDIAFYDLQYIKASMAGDMLFILQINDIKNNRDINLMKYL